MACQDDCTMKTPLFASALLFASVSLFALTNVGVAPGGTTTTPTTPVVKPPCTKKDDDKRPTTVPEGPLVGVNEVMVGGRMTLKFVALLAVPLAVSVGRAETNVNAALALGVALSYYLMTSMASWVKVPALHPELLVLLPNFVVMGFALWLMRRAGGK